MLALVSRFRKDLHLSAAKTSSVIQTGTGKKKKKLLLKYCNKVQYTASYKCQLSRQYWMSGENRVIGDEITSVFYILDCSTVLLVQYCFGTY